MMKKNNYKQTINKNIPRASYILGDSLKEMEKLDDKSIDMVFADPPYNLQITNKLTRPDSSIVNGVSEKWDKFNSLKEYDNFTSHWLSQVKRILKPNGTLWTIGTYHNIYRIGFILQNLNFWILNDIIWRKTNPMPNFRGTRFTNAHENIIWASVNKDSKYKFNYQSMKSLNDELQMRSDWLINVCGGKERIKTQDNIKLHPTQKPEALLYRIIMASSDINDVILDPFFGTGTTGVVAKKLKRRFIGIEKDPKYLIAAKERINKIRNTNTINIALSLNNQTTRVPFGKLVENGIIKPGSKLYDSKKSIKATVLADGRIKFKKIVGSIHVVSAIIQNTESCNGWTYWHTEKRHKLLSIDHHRKQFSNS